MNEAEKRIRHLGEEIDNFMKMAKAQGITIDDLPAAAAAEADDLIEIQKGQESLKLSLQQIIDQIMNIVGAHTTDYHALTNKPQIAGVTLEGNKTAAALNLVDNVNDQNIDGNKTFTGTTTLRGDVNIGGNVVQQLNIDRLGGASGNGMSMKSSTNHAMYIDMLWRGSRRMVLGKGSLTKDEILFMVEGNWDTRFQGKNWVFDVTDNVDMNNKPIVNLAPPTGNNDAVNKAYVDDKIAKLPPPTEWYTNLKDKPLINGVELIKDKSSAQLGLIGRAELKDIANQSTDFNDFKRRIGQL